DHRRWCVRDVAAGRAGHGHGRCVLRGDRPRRLYRLHADDLARRQAGDAAPSGRRAVALGKGHAAMVDVRGHGPRHPGRADQDRRTRNRGRRHRDVCGGRVGRAPDRDHDDLRPAGHLDAGRVGGSMTAVALTAVRAGLVSCEACSLLVRPASLAEPGFCPRCGEELVWRRHHSIQYTWPLVVAAAICYIPANVLPVLTTNALGSSEPDTIMGGVILLYRTGSWPLALIVLVASVMVPLGKLVALSYLLITVHR